MNIRFLIVSALACVLLGSTTRSGLGEDASPCATLSFEGNAYTVCRAPLRDFSIRLFWQNPDGKPYKYLSTLPQKNEKGEALAFALNAGMYDNDYKPVGLYVENGNELVSPNTKSGSANFSLKPNGVFYIGDDLAGVAETGAFLKKRVKPDFATQSGPMLVIDGRLHPRIAKARTSKKPRDGVCVQDSKIAIFAISDGDVPFDTFERLFRDQLKCRNALFLDGGSAPALYWPAAARRGNSFIPLGPMIAVYKKARP